jgi:hypothetical protein
MGWKEFTEMIYYTLLKRGQILIAILGLIVAILVYLNAQKYGIGVAAVEKNVIAGCQTDNDCIEDCGKCVSGGYSSRCVLNTSVTCNCINKTCTKVT